MNEAQISQKLKRKPDLINREYYLVSEVLLPLIEVSGGWELLFEVRSKKLSRQPGEICFPGGHVEGIEHSRPGLAAQREAAEELGLANEDIKTIGTLDRLITPFGVMVRPFVGRILTPDNIVPNQAEVDHIFSVPLSFLCANPPRVSSLEVATRYSPDFPIDRVPEKYRGGWDGWVKNWTLPAYIYEYQNYFIWGMTALILHNFLNVIADD